MARLVIVLSLMFLATAVRAAEAAPSPSPTYPGGAGCEKPIGAPALIAPCIGPPGTTVFVYPQQPLPSLPDTIIFRHPPPAAGPVPGSTVPLELVCLYLTSVQPITVQCPEGRRLWKAPVPNLCPYGTNWFVFLHQRDGKESRIGTFKLNCKRPPTPHLGPPPPPGTPTPTPTLTPGHKRRTPEPTITTLFSPLSKRRTPEPTITTLCVPAAGSPVHLKSCDLFATEMIQLDISGGSTYRPTTILLQSATPGTTGILTAPVLPTTSGALGFMLPSFACKHVPTQWNLFAVDANHRQVPIGLYTTTC